MSELDRTAAPTITLADFLIDRIAEDEEFLRNAWQQRGARFSVHYERGEDPDVNTPLGLSRQLAECDAKRRIVELHWPEQVGWGPDVIGCRTCDCILPETWGPDLLPAGESLYPCDTICALALPYAGHPDWREEWRP